MSPHVIHEVTYGMIHVRGSSLKVHLRIAKVAQVRIHARCPSIDRHIHSALQIKRMKLGGLANQGFISPLHGQFAGHDLRNLPWDNPGGPKFLCMTAGIARGTSDQGESSLL
jgi:hypothetical protein